MAKIAALAFSVSKTVSIISTSAPPWIRPRAASLIGRAQFVEGDVAEGRDRSTSGEMEAVRLVGPSTPATRRGRSAVDASSQISRASRAPCLVQLADQMVQAVIGLARCSWS